MTDGIFRGGDPVRAGEVGPAALENFRQRAEQARQRAAKRRAGQQPPSDMPDELADAWRADERDAAHRRWLDTWPEVCPRRYRDARVDQLDGQLATLAGQWDGTQNVLLLGSIGVGKTHAAVAMARTAFEAGRSVMFRSSVWLLDELRPGGREGALDEAVSVDVLVLDDLGVERPTEWTAERLHALVCSRHDQVLPTLVTSNVASDKLEQAHPRIWSRLLQDALAFEIAGGDRRRGRG